MPRESPSPRCGRPPRGARSRRRARRGRRARRSGGRFLLSSSLVPRVRPPMAGAWLILPTYNEAENLERIVRAALPRLAEAVPEHHILVVDDGSPDGTGEIADRLAAEHGEVEVLHRNAKSGLG